VCSVADSGETASAVKPLQCETAPVVKPLAIMGNSSLPSLYFSIQDLTDHIPTGGRGRDLYIVCVHAPYPCRPCSHAPLYVSPVRLGAWGDVCTWRNRPWLVVLEDATEDGVHRCSHMCSQ